MSETNWSAIGTGLAIAFIAFMQVWQTWKQKQVAAKQDAIAVKVDSTAMVVEAVHKSTDGTMTLQKKALAEVTAAKHAVTGLPIDKIAAETALKDYLDHVAQKTKENGGHEPSTV